MVSRGKASTVSFVNRPGKERPMEKRNVFKVTLFLVSPSEEDAREFITQHGTFDSNTQTTLLSVQDVSEDPEYVTVCED